LPTNCLVLPYFFFFCAVAALSALDILCAFFKGRHRSGFFLSLLVPHAPKIEPSVPMRTHFSFLHFSNSPSSYAYIIHLHQHPNYL
jgi:hypothetical protein